MNVAQLIDRIIDAYPGASGPAMGTFRQAYADRLRRHEGVALAKAATEVFGSFKPTHRQPFPIPVDFEQHLPSGKVALDGATPKLDFRRHRERKAGIIAEWFEAEGRALTSASPDLWLAFETIVEPLAYRMAWSEKPGELRLKPADILVARKRAVSQRRRLDFGPPPKDPEVWWDQIVEVMQRWDLDIGREDWTQPEPRARQRAA